MKNNNKFGFIFVSIISLSVIILSIIFKNYWLATLNGIIGLFSIYFQAKGVIFAPIIGIVDCLCYGIFALQYNYIGEFIVYIIILIPIYIYGIIEWNIHKDKDNTIIPKNINKKEMILLIIFSFAIIIGSYLLLNLLNSDQILLNTLSIYTLTYSNYLLSRRSLWGFIYYLLNDIILIALWFFPILNGDLHLIAFFICIISYFVCDIYGIVNWKKRL